MADSCPAAIVDIACGFAEGTTPIYSAQIVSANGLGVGPSNIASLTLSIVDTGSGAIVNGVDLQNILNTDRGTVDDQGNLMITLRPGDTTMSEVPGLTQVRRSLIIDWTGGDGSVGRLQVNFLVIALAGP